MTPPPSPRPRALAEAAARAAAAQLLTRYRLPLAGLHAKANPGDLVSEADEAAEAAIRELILADYPDDAILGEEEGQSAGVSGVRWIVDPLDGTANYVRGLPLWCVSVACEDEHGLCVGVVYDPLADEMFATERGAGCVYVNGQPAPTPAFVPDSLAGACYTGTVRHLPPQRALAFEAAQSQVGQRRGLGSAALSCAWTAVGRLDLVYFEIGHLANWDVAAGVLLCQEAGQTAQWLAPGVGGEHPRFVAGSSDLLAQWLELLP